MKKCSRAAIAVVAITVFYNLSPTSALGARFPNAVEKTTVVTGDTATLLARLFGMSTSGSSSLSLPLDKNMAWAVYLIRRDTKTPLYDGDGPPRWNRVRFSTSPLPTLTLGPFWLDLATALPNSQPGYYSFSSPFVAQDLNGDDAWSKMLKTLKGQPGWVRAGFPQFQRCLTSSEKTEICVAVYGSKDYANNVERAGYKETITVRSP